MSISGNHNSGYKIRNLDARFANRQELGSSYIASAPYGGVWFETAECVKAGDIVVVSIRLEEEAKRADLLGTVLWVRKRVGSGLSEVAVGFFESEFEQREALFGQVEKTSSRQRREPRIDVVLPVTFTHDRSFLVARTRNISRNGACIEALDAPEREVSLNIHTGLDRPPLSVSGRVVWKRPGLDFGMEVYPAGNTQSALEELVEWFEHRNGAEAKSFSPDT